MERVAVVTGASSGIGAACALKLAAARTRLVLVARNQENLDKIARECENIFGNPLTIIADISVDADVERIVAETMRHYGRVDVLVNNAGIYLNSEVQDAISTFDRIMATNVRGTYLLTSLFVPHLTATKGCIVNISSVLSTKAKAGLSAYCMSKAALDMFTKAAAVELGSSGIRVNAVNPGPVDTPLFRRAGMSEVARAQLFETCRGASPLRRLARPEDVASMVEFLASVAAASVTGACLAVDAGISLGN